MLAGSRAVPQPDRAGPQHTTQLPGARKVGPVARPQREVLMVTWHETSSAPAVNGILAARGLGQTGTGKPVVRVRPLSRQLRVEPGGSQALGEL